MSVIQDVDFELNSTNIKDLSQRPIGRIRQLQVCHGGNRKEKYIRIFKNVERPST